MHSEWTQNLHTFINPVNTRTPTSNLPTRGGHSLVTLSSMLLTRPERLKPPSKQKKGPPGRHPWKVPPLGNPWFCWKNQPFSLDIKAITSQWHVPEKRSVLVLTIDSHQSDWIVCHRNKRQLYCVFHKLPYIQITRHSLYKCQKKSQNHLVFRLNVSRLSCAYLRLYIFDEAIPSNALSVLLPSIFNASVKVVRY